MDSVTRWLGNLSFGDPILWLVAAVSFGIVLAFMLMSRKPVAQTYIIVPPDPDLPTDGSPPPIARYDERRKSIRREGMPTPLTIFDVNAKGKTYTYEAYVLDRSSGGIKVAIDKPIPVGTFLDVRPTNAPDTFDKVSLIVRSCRETQDYFVLGCEFEKPLDISQLLMFG
ncbi:MAG: PilZ domain-containing protein [Zavarzinella sp.]